MPLALTAAVLAVREGAERDRAFWRRGALALGIAGLALLPFFLPYRTVAKLYGFERGLDDAREYSALPKDWLNADQRSHFWRAFTGTPSPPERALFPGFLLLALPLAALILSAAPRARAAPPPGGKPPSPRLLAWLDGIALVAGGLALFAASPSGIHLRIAGKEVFRATEPWRALAVFALAVLVRVVARVAEVGSARAGEEPAGEPARRTAGSDALVVGGLWAILGFFLSLGVNSVFYRLLFETVPLFRGIRVPARAATIGYLGLAVLAGAGAVALTGAWARRRPRAAPPRIVFVLACVLFLLENRVAPLDLVRGEADPDDATGSSPRPR